jgi:hypothetical protein
MLPKAVTVIEPLCKDDKPAVLVHTYCLELAPTVRGDVNAKLCMEPIVHENETGSCALE